MENKTNNPQNIQIKVSDEVLKGFYANNVLFMHTKGEIVMDFMTILPPNGVLGARVITSPQHAKRFAKALQDNIAMYEKSFGEIKEIEDPNFKISGTH